MGIRHVAIITVAAFWSAGSLVAPAMADERPPWCEPGVIAIDASRIPAVVPTSVFDLTGAVVQFGSVAIAVPPPGMTGMISTSAAEGASSAEELAVTTLANGDVVVEAEPLSLNGSNGSTTSPAACSDSTQGQGTAYKVRNVLNYGIRTGSIPSNIGSSNGVTAFQNALNNIRTGANDCGLTSQPNAPGMNYTGATATVGNISVSGSTVTCTSPDNSHVVEFGTLPSDKLGVACSWWDGGGTLTNFDQRLRSANSWDYTLSDGCFSTSAYDISAVATHEWGHVYGISHVAESTSGNLTMSAVINGPCQTSERTLGVGDRNHLIAKYGTR